MNGEWLVSITATHHTMRQIIILALSGLTIFGCNIPTEKNKRNISNNQTLTHTERKRFFDYDEIDYYFNDSFKEAEMVDLIGRKSELDSLKKGILLGNIPKGISDLSFINNLEKIGYKKSLVDNSKFGDIDKIFVEKSVKENIATSCEYIYRDILIFKLNKNIIGTAKICFGCMANEITGTNANTDNFGQDGDYRRLRNLLRK